MRVLQTALFALAAAATAFAAPGASAKKPSGFVSAKGTQFELDGKPFAFVGANSYWLPLLTKQSDIELTFKGMKDAGIKVLRTWGFNAINGTELAGAKESGLTYYQVWNSSEWQLNTGKQGLQRLDNVIETAGKYGIKVILTFTNNWVGYGGSELYLNWILGSNVTHDVFYTDKKVIASYQKYVKALVNRYKSSPNIFAWELMNEGRCLGDLPGSSACRPGSNTIHNWYEQQAAFVRTLDPYHMITTGGEGQFNQEDPVKYWYNGQLVSDYNFNGQAGEDFDADLALENIDFGVYHMYPQYWYGNLDYPGSNFSMKDWGVSWQNWHVKSAKKQNKPLVIEEFGMAGLSNKTSIYPSWVGNALDTRHAILPWQFGQLGLTENGGNRAIKYADAIIDGASPNDGFTYYPNQTVVWEIFTNAAKVQNARSR